MTKKEMELLNCDILKKIAKEKGKKGNATTKAKIAQEILWDRSGRPFEHDELMDFRGGDVAPETADQGYYEGAS